MRRKILSITTILLIGLLFLPQNILAHCDGLDGPVILAARKALETGNVNYALVWVQKTDEETIKETFQHTLKVRALSEEAKELADMFFFEMLVRVHRAGEGAPFTGLKPAGRDLGPAIPAADKALETGSPKELLSILNEEVHNGLHGRYMKALELKNYDPNDVQAGQAFVKAYVDYFHFAEGIYSAAHKSGDGHGGESAKAENHHEH
ncbi:MAG TPA: DUF6448 family protein [Ignavibacteriales bacterium]|nr:DUF6448 family protein [Ignavibacteriales bacterium]